MIDLYVHPFLNHASVIFASVCAVLLALLLAAVLYMLLYKVRVVAINIRHDKLNSQFIVTKISILHAGGRSFFIFQTSSEC